MMIAKLFRAEFFRFVCAGSAGFIVDYLTVLFCVQCLLLSPYISRVFSFLAAVSATYVLNKKFTFAARIRKTDRDPGLLPYALLMLFGLCVNYAAYLFVLYAVSFLPLQLRLLIAVGAGSLAGMGVNFFMCRVFLFRINI
jgi:putative flippase GtrA